MSVWSIIEGLLTESRAYRGQGQVKYSDLVKLLEYLGGGPKGDISTWDPRDKSGKPKKEPKPKIIGTSGGGGTDPRHQASSLPAREGGWADVDFKVVPKVWNRWASSVDAAIGLATSTDDPVPQRTHWVQHVGALGKKGFTQTQSDKLKNPTSPMVRDRSDGGSTRDTSTPQYGHARPSDLYDFIAVADIEGHDVPQKGVTDVSRSEDATVVVKRIAWTPSIGDSNERASRLRSLLAGKAPESQAPKLGPKPPQLGKPGKPDQNAGAELMKKGPSMHAPIPGDQEKPWNHLAQTLGPRHKQKSEPDQQTTDQGLNSDDDDDEKGLEPSPAWGQAALRAKKG